LYQILTIKGEIRIKNSPLIKLNGGIIMLKLTLIGGGSSYTPEFIEGLVD